MSKAPPDLSRALDVLGEFFSRRLFRGKDELPRVLINVTRRVRPAGQLKKQLWLEPKTDEILAEINVNLDVLHTDEAVCSAICHQLVLVWQRRYGNPSRPGYHNREWAEKMIEIGLMPSSTGRPGGATVGQEMSHFAIQGGRFLKAFNSLPKQVLTVPRLHRVQSDPSASSRKRTYYCPCRPTNRCLAPTGFRARCSFCGAEFVVKVPKTQR